MKTEQYPLYQLERIIVKDISAFIQMQYPVPQALASDFQKAIKEETERIKHHIALAVLHFKEKRKRHFIQHHQLNLIQLCCKLLEYLPPRQLIESKSIDNTLLCRCLHDALEELLLFVEKHYPKYYNRDAWIPAAYRRIAVYDLQRNITTIQNKLLKQGIHPQLVGLALHPLREFVSNSSIKKVTYSRLMFLKRLKDELQNFEFVLEEDTSMSFQFRLLYLNLNTIEYYNYCVNQIQSHVREASNVPEKIERLAFVQKLLHQAPVKSKWGYNPNIISLKKQLTVWSKQEMEYLKVSEQVESELAGCPAIKPGKTERLKVTISVAQFAYLLRVFIEANVILPKSVNSLIQTIITAFRTKEANILSYRSFSNKYYNVEYSTRQAVKKVLQQMIDYIDMK